jgi:hypothetical protein
MGYFEEGGTHIGFAIRQRLNPQEGVSEQEGNEKYLLLRAHRLAVEGSWGRAFKIGVRGRLCVVHRQIIKYTGSPKGEGKKKGLNSKNCRFTKSANFQISTYLLSQ